MTTSPENEFNFENFIGHEVGCGGFSISLGFDDEHPKDQAVIKYHEAIIAVVPFDSLEGLKACCSSIFNSFLAHKYKKEVALGQLRDE